MTQHEYQISFKRKNGSSPGMVFFVRAGDKGEARHKGFQDLKKVLVGNRMAGERLNTSNYRISEIRKVR